MKANLKSVTCELASVVENIDETKIEKVAESLESAHRIFVKGVGRSGLMMEAFAMRLMHLGFTVHTIGCATTPAARKEDLLILGTGSGETGSLITYANKAEKLGMKMITLTSTRDSTLGRMADVVLPIPTPTKSANTSRVSSIQPMGTLFEQSLLICLDILILELMESTSVNSAQMFGRHANLE